MDEREDYDDIGSSGNRPLLSRLTPELVIAFVTLAIILVPTLVALVGLLLFGLSDGD